MIKRVFLTLLSWKIDSTHTIYPKSVVLLSFREFKTEPLWGAERVFGLLRQFQAMSDEAS